MQKVLTHLKLNAKTSETTNIHHQHFSDQRTLIMTGDRVGMLNTGFPLHYTRQVIVGYYFVLEKNPDKNKEKMPPKIRSKGQKQTYEWSINSKPMVNLTHDQLENIWTKAAAWYFPFLYHLPCFNPHYETWELVSHGKNTKQWSRQKIRIKYPSLEQNRLHVAMAD